MNPKEKASEIISRFRGFEMPNEKISTKQCALIVVEEIIISIVMTYLTTAESQLKYWEKVKKEIEYTNL